MPGAQTRNRKPRFPERALLDRIRGYEELLRQNNVRFEPLAKDMIADRHSVESDAVGDEASEVGDAQSSTVESEKTHVPKYAPRCWTLHVANLRSETFGRL